MISYALKIVESELKKHLEAYSSSPSDVNVGLGNPAEGIGNGGIARDTLNLSVVNINEEKTLKNLPNYKRNDTTLRVAYENPSVFLNFQILIIATHSQYPIALTALSRVICFFQQKNVFTQDNVSPESIGALEPLFDPLDRLTTFKLIFDLYSPTMEEVNHLWGTLGGKQYPFVLYRMRMLDLKFEAIQSESGVITEVVSNFFQKNST